MKTYIKTSVPRPAGSPGKGITPKDVLTLIDVEDIVSFPPRDGAGVVLVGDIVVKPSEIGRASCRERVSSPV